MSKTSKTIVVTGGAGFVGSHTVDALLAAGERVLVLDDFSSGSRENLPSSHPRLSVVEGDVLDEATVASTLKGARACLHLAAQVSVKRSLIHPQQSLDINVKGFVNVLEAARRLGLKRLVYASSAAVYGDVHRLPVRENQPLHPISPYGLEKLTTERYAALYTQLYGLSILGLRYFNIYGSRQPPASPYSGVISKFVQCFRDGTPPTVFGDGRQTRDFIYVKDVAAANIAALDHPFKGVCNIGTGRSVSLLTLIQELRRLTGKALRPRFSKAVAGDIRHSRAQVRFADEALGFRADFPFRQGLEDLWS